MCLCPCIKLKVIFYRGLPVFYFVIALNEAGLGFGRYTGLTHGVHPILDNTSIRIAVALDCIGSTIAILTGLLVCSLICVTLISYICCLCGGHELSLLLCKSFCEPATYRFVSFNCNCPFYVTRPKARFCHRIMFLIASLILRIIAIIIYATAKISDPHEMVMLVYILCGFSIVCPVCMIFLDVYRYRIWWHYRPSVDDETSCQKLSPKHVRFLPYHLLGDNRSMVVPGNQPCVNQNVCTMRDLEHIMIFHSSAHSPQLRWQELNEVERERGIYVGFHRTTAEAAVSIAHSNFRISRKPPQMLGFGIYFARSIKGTEGKARHSGATICAEIQMGKVKEVTRSELHTVSNSSRWWDDYDTAIKFSLHQK